MKEDEDELYRVSRTNVQANGPMIMGAPSIRKAVELKVVLIYEGGGYPRFQRLLRTMSQTIILKNRTRRVELVFLSLWM
jgi:hypothetical protein